VLVAEIERLQVPAAPQIPHMHPVSVFLAEQELRHDAPLDHTGRSPLAGEQDIVPEMPPEIVGQLLRSPIDLPAAAWGLGAHGHRAALQA
jgi:hypothetical protein